jgi:urease accessory protein
MSSQTGFVGTFSSNPDRIGRDGFLQLRFSREQNRTVLNRCRFRLPLQALAPTELADGTAYLMLLNPTGGLVGGDTLFTEISQDAETRLCLTTPSATRVYRTLGSPAVQETLIRVGECASLEYLPDHVIPHRHSRLRQTLRIELGAGSRGIIWDALAAGRVACGERWHFDEIDSRLRISLNGRDIFLNRTLIRPSRQDPRQLGIAEDFNYMATLVVVCEESDSAVAIVSALNTQLAGIPGIYGGASLLANGGGVVKLLTRSAADLMRAQSALWTCTRQALFGSCAVDLRKY